MSEIYYIEDNINECNLQIEENNNKIQSLRDRIRELEYIKSKLGNTQEKLYDYRSIKRSRFVNMKERFTNVKFASECSDEMLSYIDGNRANLAHNSIDSAIMETKNEITRKETEIVDLENENFHLENRISNLKARKLELESERGD